MYIYIYGIRKNRILQFVTTWMDWVGIMLMEICQSRKQMPYVCFHCYIEFNKLKKLKRKKTENKKKTHPDS